MAAEKTSARKGYLFTKIAKKQGTRTKSVCNVRETLLAISVASAIHPSCSLPAERGANKRRSVRGGKQIAELVVLNFAGAVLIDILDQLFDVDGHLKLFLDDADKPLRVD